VHNLNDSVIIREIINDLFLIRINDSRTKYFEALWEIPEGITYNAYILRLPQGSVLFDGSKGEYISEFSEALSRLVNPKDIKYIVVHHAEPDHTGSLKEFLNLNGNRAVILGHPMTKVLLQSLHGINSNFRAVKDGEELVLNGEVLKFIYTPWLHWPETMVTYLKQRNILLTCDVFGGYSIPEGVFDDESNVENYMYYLRKYATTVIGHYRGYVLKALEKLRMLKIKPSIIAPGHGLLWRSDINRVVKAYESWDKAEPVKGKIVIMYSSMYGYVESAIKYVVKELSSLGIKPVIFRFTDKERASLSDILTEAGDSQGIIVGTATYEAGVFPLISNLLTVLASKVKVKKHVMLITTYGWGDVAGRVLASAITNAGYKLVSSVSIHGLLTEEVKKKIREGVKKLINSINP